jgi:carbamoyl-phosphate synthase large subunit
VVVKFPRWAFEKFPQADPTLTTQMKSVGETMAIGRTFQEAFQKACRSLEVGRAGWVTTKKERENLTDSLLEKKLRIPNAERFFYLKIALEKEISLQKINTWTGFDPWFLNEFQEILDFETTLKAIKSLQQVPKEIFLEAKKKGFSDAFLATLYNTDEATLRKTRKSQGILPSYKLVDTCAGEFEAYTPYFYSTYEDSSEIKVTPNKRKIMILGGGPNRIGQGIEFDYCCVHASFALREMGIESIMVNSNPETISTDYDVSDRLFFEPLTFEDVMNIYEATACDGVIVQLGGQTPLNLAMQLKAAGVKILGTDPEMIELAEDRKKFQKLCDQHKVLQPVSDTTTNIAEAVHIANRIGYPIIVRPSFVLGGRAMEIVYDEESLKIYMEKAVDVSLGPVLIDQFLESAVELEVDVICDGKNHVIGGILEHIEEAGIHSGDSACVLPTISVGDEALNEIRRVTAIFAKELQVVGLMNIQFALKNDRVYILEVNPRASRTAPFISKAIGVSLPRLATFVMAGKTLQELNFTQEKIPPYYCVKEAVLPFSRFPGSDILLGPEMKSTGEVMGFARTYGEAFMKAQLGAGQHIPKKGKVFISVQNADKRAITFAAEKLCQLGYEICATKGTARVLRAAGIKPLELSKLSEGGTNILTLIEKGEIALIINTPKSKGSREDEKKIRSLASVRKVPCVTTLAGALATVQGLSSYLQDQMTVISLQEYHRL